ncbi:sulfite exporter TauE/SafE family protein [Pseudonocardia sp. HH130629-09]|uniref:sulfite exporter TauE/SafE family protein n=1 Tax=Pseudonocardia sp. HH130629-09 TaxID=1641402 RepID=UPI0009E85C06|nr:sulfite exporter TauE/SafE family protein [Pseudonocardia sp. HH130629-09]
MDLWSLSASELTLVLAAAFGAGILDAAVGSGGVVLLPALLGVAPAGAAVAPLAINKAVAILGNLAAAVRYRQIRPSILRTRVLLLYIGCGLLALSLGVFTASQFSVSEFTPIVIAALLLLAVYMTWSAFRGGASTEGGSEASAPVLSPATPAVVASIGFYDGFIGPATGSLLQTALSRLSGRPVHDCLADSRAIQGVFNLASATLLWIVATPDWKLVLVLAIANIIGSLVGTVVAGRISEFYLKMLLAICIVASAVRLAIIG